MKSSQTKPPLRPIREKPPGLFREFVGFLKHNKRWWIPPIIIVLALFAIALAVLGSSGVAPFIYSRY